MSNKPCPLDPNCTEGHEGMVFYKHQWRSPEAVERSRERERKHRKERSAAGRCTKCSAESSNYLCADCAVAKSISYLERTLVQ